MNVWTLNDWKSNLNDGIPRRTGIRFRYDKTVNPEVKRACTQFAIEYWILREMGVNMVFHFID